MKIFLLFLTIICSVSCVSTKVSSKNNYDYSVLRNNSKYIIETKDGNKVRQFEFLRQTENLIPIFATASPKQPAPENPPGWERSKGNWLSGVI